MDLGPLNIAQLTPVPGFYPYPSSPGFKGVTEAEGSNRLLPAVAVDYVKMGDAFRRDRSQDLLFAEGYRPDGVGQWRWDEYQAGGNLSAPVGFSNHRDGTTVDLRNGIGFGPGNENFDWMFAHGATFGFYNDVASEDWHWHHPSILSVTGNISGAGTGTQTPIGPAVDVCIMKVSSKTKGKPANAFLVNINTFQALHLNGQQLKYWKDRGVDYFPDIQPYTVLAGFTRVKGAGAL